MQSASVDGRVTTSASLDVSPNAISSINHKEMALAKKMLAENSARLAFDIDLNDAEREHHAQVAWMVSR